MQSYPYVARRVSKMTMAQILGIFEQQGWLRPDRKPEQEDEYG
jgi:hypothetical protein